MDGSDTSSTSDWLILKYEALRVEVVQEACQDGGTMDPRGQDVSVSLYLSNTVKKRQGELLSLHLRSLSERRRVFRGKQKSQEVTARMRQA